jgi:DNA-binding NarL/FixJ family response regulator
MTIRVLIADDQAMVRRGLALILNQHPHIEVVGEASDGPETVALARKLRPDVSLVDIQMPRLDGIEATRALAGPHLPDPMRVIIVTTFDVDDYVDRAIAAGALGFILKDSGPALLVEAIHAAVNGEALVSPSITLRLLRRTAAKATSRRNPHPLSTRELDVVQAVATGLTNAEIAGELHISLSTVKSHISTIQTKLNMRNRVEIAAWAWEHRHVSGT